MKSGRSLTIRIGANSTVLSGETAVHKERIQAGEYITESVTYPVSSDVLLQMAEASNIDVVVTGTRGDIRAYFEIPNFETLDRFVREYVASGTP
jgi:hypothetical protein